MGKTGIVVKKMKQELQYLSYGAGASSLGIIHGILWILASWDRAAVGVS